MFVQCYFSIDLSYDIQIKNKKHWSANTQLYVLAITIFLIIIPTLLTCNMIGNNYVHLVCDIFAYFSDEYEIMDGYKNPTSWWGDFYELEVLNYSTFSIWIIVIVYSYWPANILSYIWKKSV